jgi:hypothetical protein
MRVLIHTRGDIVFCQVSMSRAMQEKHAPIHVTSIHDNMIHYPTEIRRSIPPLNGII